MRALPSGWTAAPIGMLCKLENGRAFKPAEWQTSGMPIVRIQNLNNPSAQYNYFQGGFEDRNYLGGGELLFAWSGTPGTSFGAHIWRGGQAVLNQHIFRVDFDESSLDKRFFRHAINQKLEELIGVAHGGVGLRHVTKGKFEDTEVSISPLNEQKRIADKLDAVLARVDACRKRLDRVPTILKRFRQSVLAAATSGELTADWREGTASGTEWRHSSVGALLVDIRYGTAKKCLYEPRTTPVLRIPNVIDGRVNHEDMKYAEFVDSELHKLALLAGDILMIRSNGSLSLVGRTAIVSDREAGFLYAGYLIRLRVNQVLAQPEYLSLALSSPMNRDAIELVARSTSGVNNINTAEIKSLAIPLPALEEQREIARRVEALFAYTDRLEARYAAARAQVDRLTPTLLAKAFRGELVPQDPDDEPASVLLERIRAARAVVPPKASSRQGVGRQTKTQKAEILMLNRQDISDAHLCTILRQRGPLTAEALWSASQLDIDAFYDQLKDEEARGLLKERRGNSFTDQRLLEAAA